MRVSRQRGAELIAAIAAVAAAATGAWWGTHVAGGSDSYCYLSQAELLSAGRINRLVCLDLHSRAVEGCFPQPLEHASAIPALARQ